MIVGTHNRGAGRRRWHAGLIAGLLVVSGTACGSDAKSSSTTAVDLTPTSASAVTSPPDSPDTTLAPTETSGADTTAAAAETTASTDALPTFPRTDVTIALASQTIVFWPTLIAQQMGYFDRFNLNVDTPMIAGGGNAVAALLSGDVDFTFVLGAGFAAAAQGQPIRFICKIYTGPATQVVISKEAQTRVGVAADASVDERALALAKLKIAVVGPTSSTNLETQAAFTSAGGTGGVQVVSMEMTAMRAALQSGAIDGFAGGALYASNAVNAGEAVMWLDGPGGDFASLDHNLGELPSGPLLTLQRVIDAPDELAARVAAAYLLVVDLIKNDPDAALAAAKKAPLLKDLVPEMDVSWNAEKDALVHPELTVDNLQVGLGLQEKGNPDLDSSKINLQELVPPGVYDRAVELFEFAKNAQ